MNTIKKLIAFILIIISGISLASCGFVGTTGGKAIKSIETIVENGQTKLVITYEDETIEPDKFVLPSGKDGVGIQTVIVNDKYDGTGKDIIVELTDGRRPAKFEVSNGVSVTGVTSELDTEGNTLIYVEYSDGTKSEPIKINKGEAGLGFTGMSPEPIVDEFGNSKYEIFFGPQKGEIIIPAPIKGDTGRGIDNILSYVENGKYVFEFFYSDDTTHKVEFDKPIDPATWLAGQNPSNNEGRDGDFFFDTEALKIYHKEQGKWTLIADLGVDKGTCTVKFDVNSPRDAQAKMPAGALNEYIIEKYTYFNDKANKYGDIPIPTCEGYVFKGWYTDFGSNVNETSGKFTELTPVLSDLTLYALWEKSI